MFSYVLFCKNLIALHHGDNNLLFCFDISIGGIHCEIFLSGYFMKHSLMYISLHLI